MKAVWVLLALMFVFLIVFAVPTFAQAQSETEKLVTIRVQDTPIRSAIDMLFQGSGKNYGFEAGADQNTLITVNLVDVPFTNALNTMLRAAGMTMRQENGIYMIGPKREQTTEVAAPTEWIPEVETDQTTSRDIRKLQIGFIDVGDLADIFGVQSYGTRAAYGGFGGYGGGYGMGGYGMGGYGMGGYGMGGYGMGGYGMGSYGGYGTGGYGSYGMGSYGGYGMGSYGSYGGYGGYGGGYYR
ncbi:MAG: hypothetical protein QME62_09210 [Armatimonadota bacterium]|nr:hypothetical protein [Armatimonadota bacterium]